MTIWSQNRKIYKAYSAIICMAKFKCKDGIMFPILSYSDPFPQNPWDRDINGR